VSTKGPPLHPYRGQWPEVAEDAWVAPTAAVIGAVTLGPASTIWYGAVLRGDVMPIRVGARTSIQDNAVIHSTGGWQEATVGDDVTVGHGVILHGCAVEDRVLVGMGSIVLDGARLGADSMLGAGSLVPPRKVIPSGVLALGRPAKVVRELTDEERARILEASSIYVGLGREYGA
jgi:carbonic anhydrase/acetyltransferase-like protein (isoleucine patch superfamily)